VLADAIDWTACSIRGVLSGGSVADCRQDDMTIGLPASVLNPAAGYNYRQTRGVRILWFTLPILSGYNVTAASLPLRTTVVNVTHTDVDDFPALQSLLERLALTNTISAENSADETESASQ
jgi:hypothetical protein